MASGRSSTGYLAGLLTGMMMLGRTITSPFWGWYTDRYGRKPTLVFGIASTVVLSIAFAFVVDFWMALAIRFVLGLLAPLGLVTKTVIAEIAPEHMQATVASIYASCWLVGGVCGIIAGGLLVEPDKTGLAPIGFFKEWPYALPNLVTALIGFISLIGVVIWTKETLKKKEELTIQPAFERTTWDLLRDPQVRLITSLYGLNTFTYTAFTELIPLWCWGSKRYHGLEFSPQEISYALAAANVALVATQQFTFRHLAKAKGLKWCNTWSCFISIPITFAVPWIAFTSNTIGIWVYIIIFIFLFLLLNFTALTSQLVLSNNAVLICERGRLNGLLIFVGSILRALAPTLMGVLYAATNESGLPFPLDFTFCFSLLTLVGALMWWLSMKVPIELQRPKDARMREEVKATTAHNSVKSLLPKNERSSVITETGFHQYDELPDDDEEMGQQEEEDHKQDKSLNR